MRLKKTQKSTKKSNAIVWKRAIDVEKQIKDIIRICKMEWISFSSIHCFRSINAKTSAFARIWGLGRIWQLALSTKPSYVIEVISEKYDQLPLDKKIEILIHELTHIPKNFSGSLIPHYRKGKRKFHDMVHQMVIYYNHKKG